MLRILFINYYLRFTIKKDNVYYCIKLEFEDKRKQITFQYTLLLLNQWLLEDEYIPNELVSIIVDYLGHSYFYYGSFKITCKVDGTYYNKYDEGDDIPIRYDPKYPRDAETEHDIGCCVLGRSYSFLVMACFDVYDYSVICKVLHF